MCRPRGPGTLGTDVTAVLAEVRAAAEGSGWSVDFEQHNGAFRATKVFTVDGEQLRGRLLTGPQEIGGSPGAEELYIALDAYPA